MTKNKDNLGETNYAERRGRNGHLQVLGTFSSPPFGGGLGRGRNRIACAKACPKPFVHFVTTNYYCVIAVSPQKPRCLARSAMLPIQRSIQTRAALPVVHTIKASGFGLLLLGVEGKAFPYVAHTCLRGDDPSREMHGCKVHTVLRNYLCTTVVLNLQLAVPRNRPKMCPLSVVLPRPPVLI